MKHVKYLDKKLNNFLNLAQEFMLSRCTMITAGHTRSKKMYNCCIITIEHAAVQLVMH
jgi:hypothetical protein